MNETIRTSAKRRGITRLCHFAPSRNLVHIVTDPRGLLASRHLKSDEKAVFNPTDLDRFDGFPDHVCCSIQYPNAWYFRKARDRDRLFVDWTVVLIKPHHLWVAGTKFCPRNAAAGFGRDVREGPNAFEGLFALKVMGAYSKTYSRSRSRPAWLPTDEQAEVLIPDKVSRDDVLGIVVLDESQAKREAARFEMLKERVPRIVVAPTLFDPHQLSSALGSGFIPEEREFLLGDNDGGR